MINKYRQLLTYRGVNYFSHPPKFSKFANEFQLDKDFIQLKKEIEKKQKITSNGYLIAIGFTIATIITAIMVTIFQDSRRQRLKLWKNILYYNFLQPKKQIGDYKQIVNGIYKYCQKYMSKNRIQNPVIKRQLMFFLKHEEKILNVSDQFIRIVNYSTLLTDRKLLQMLPIYQQVITYALHNNMKGLDIIAHLLMENGNIRQQYIGMNYLKKFNFPPPDIDKAKNKLIANTSINNQIQPHYQLLKYQIKQNEEWICKIKQFLK